MTLTVNRLHFGYQHKAIFKEISLSIPQGKLVGIVGPNGGGKSTLLKLLAGQEQPQSGEILLKGKPLGSYGMKALARELAHLLGGELSLESRLGEGCTFTLTLPIAGPSAPPI